MPEICSCGGTLPCPYKATGESGHYGVGVVASTWTPDTVREFLLARISDDEALAHTAGAEEWEMADCCGSKQIQTVKEFGVSPAYMYHQAITMDHEGLSDSVDEDAGPHIARWNPFTVLTKCKVDRQVVELLFCDVQDPRNAVRRGWAAEILCGMALPYKDHPDYRSSW